VAEAARCYETRRGVDEALNPEIRIQRRALGNVFVDRLGGRESLAANR